MSRLIYALILLVLMVVFAGFAAINREVVRVNFDFLSPRDSLLSFEAPLFLVIVGAGLIGMAFGVVLPLLDLLRKKQRAWREKLWKQENKNLKEGLKSSEDKMV